MADDTPNCITYATESEMVHDWNFVRGKTNYFFIICCKTNNREHLRFSVKGRRLTMLRWFHDQHVLTYLVGG